MTKEPKKPFIHIWYNEAAKINEEKKCPKCGFDWDDDGCRNCGNE